MIRKLKPTDLDAVLAIEEKAFYTPWTRQQFLYELNENPYAHLWALIDEDSQQLIGYYDLWVIFERAELANIAIAPAHQKKGYGSVLMRHLEHEALKAECETISLEVRISNTAALHLYQQHDFVIINTRKDYYEGPDGHEDAYLMMKGI